MPHTLTTPMRPYEAMLDIASSGRVFLARAMVQYCCGQWGADPDEIVDALAAPPGPQLDGQHAIRLAAGLLGRAFADGAAATFARPFHGGVPIPLAREVWELDRHEPRFLHCALDPERPFDPEASPTHWIFVDAEDWDVLLEASWGNRSVRRIREESKQLRHSVERPTEPEPASPVGDLLRIADVRKRTKLGRSTIYAKMGRGEFPRTVHVEGNVASWREEDVDAWIASRT